MSSNLTRDSVSASAPPGGLVGPVVLLLVVSAVVMMSAMSFTVRRQDGALIESSVHVTRTALVGIAADLKRRSTRLARSADFRRKVLVEFDPLWLEDNLGPAFAEDLGVSTAIVTGGDGRPLYAMVDGRVRGPADGRTFLGGAEGGLENLMKRAETSPTDAPRPATGLLRLGGVIHSVAVTRLAPDAGAAPDQAGGRYLVLATKLDRDLLSALGADYLLQGLGVHAGENDFDGAIPLIAADGGRLGVLTWRLAVPGRLGLADLIPPLSVAWLAIIGLAWVFVQRSLSVAGELERGRNLAREKAILERSERELRTGEARYRNLFEQSPIAIREEDWSGLREMVSRLQSSGEGDLRRALSDHLSADPRALAPLKIIDVNQATLDVYRARDKETCIRNIEERMVRGMPEGAEEVLAVLAEGEARFVTETVEQTFDGSDIIVRKWVQVPAEHEDTWARVLVSVEDVTERREAEERVQYLAHYDVLTGLPNREYFIEQLQSAVAVSRRSNETLAVLFLDLDDFKSVNDTLGHSVGDALLKAVAGRLNNHMRDSDALARNARATVSRFGGDEFTIILRNLENPDNAATAADRILETFSQSFSVEGKQIYVGASIGIALFPGDGDDPEQLLRNADLALYRSKADKRVKYHFFVPEMDAEVVARKTMENDLRGALARKELWLCYQPQVDLSSGRIAGMEALLRWTHPERGEVSPVKFIPIAENTSLILSLGEWAVRQACAQNKAWQDAGLPPVSVTVNVSGAQIAYQDVLAMVEKALRDSDLEPRYLHIEVTESVVMQHLEPALATLEGLRALGIKVYLDDFGTGYSSLSYLKRFPIDTLKIDRSFVRDITTSPADAAIARTIINMAHVLDMKVTAEGVETEEQLEFLRSEGCQMVQGNYFSPPVPALDLAALLREGSLAPAP